MFTAEHDRLRELDPLGLSRPELLRVIDELHRLEKRAEERRLRFTAAIDALGDNGADGAAVTRRLTHASARKAKSIAAAATALTAMPKTAEALARGDIDSEHVLAAASAADATSPAEADQLADHARSVPADLFKKRAREWTNGRVRNDQREERRQRQLANREAHWWKTDDGMTHIHAVLDAHAGRQAVAELDERVERLWREDGGRDGTPNDVRSTAQRRADALVGFLIEMSGEPSISRAGRPHPKTMVIVHLNARTGEAEFTDGEPVPRSLLAELGPAAEVVGIIYGSDGQPLHLGRSVRLADRNQWIALIDRDRGCVRCGDAPSRCHAHHIVESSDLGPTDVDNLELDCHRDHQLIHRHGFDPRRRPKTPRAA